MKDNNSEIYHELLDEKSEEKIFEYLCDSNGKLSVSRFKSLLAETGLRETDPRLKESMTQINKVEKHHFETNIEHGEHGAIYLDKETFSGCIAENIELIMKAFSNQFIIPEFVAFKKDIGQIYRFAKANTNGKVPSYIPQLARYKSDLWAVSVCTVDGQRHSEGDTDTAFCLQSMSKPLTYAIVTDEHGPEYVHQYVSHESSGRSFNEISLDYKNKPHNPMINSGAIVTTSLLKPDMNIADRFDFLTISGFIGDVHFVRLVSRRGTYDVQRVYSIASDSILDALPPSAIASEITQTLKRMTGSEYLAFNNSVYLSERQTTDRNFALGYYLRENNCFPKNVDLMETLEFYFMLCSFEVTCDSLSVIAATLANGGVCPITGDNILRSYSVRDTLSMMQSCGMCDYSGEFAFKVGLPAKSGVSGGIMLVIPNVMGIGVWSPPVDEFSNSCRGIQFCQNFVSKFSFHCFDDFSTSRLKMDPRRSRLESHVRDIVSLLCGASKGDLTALKRYVMLGLDMELSDYDGRTALHVAAAEGHYHIVKYLLEKCKVSANTKDRWGHTALDDAKRFGHDKCAEILKFHTEVSQAEAKNPH